MARIFHARLLKRAGSDRKGEECGGREGRFIYVFILCVVFLLYPEQGIRKSSNALRQFYLIYLLIIRIALIA